MKVSSIIPRLVTFVIDAFKVFDCFDLSVTVRFGRLTVLRLEAEVLSGEKISSIEGSS